MGFKDNIVNNIALHIADAIDKKVNGKEIVEKIKDDLKAKGALSRTVDEVCAGPFLNLTGEMQEGLCPDKKKLAEWHRKEANRLEPTSQAKPVVGKTIPEKKSR